MKQTHGVVLVGHGAIPKDYPRELVTQLRTLEAQRRTSGGDPTDQEQELETRLRRWPRTPKTDPYQAGLEALAAHMQPLLPEACVRIAYLEFCAPTLEEVVDALYTAGVLHITVVPSMLTSGGVHSEVDIPAILDLLRACYPDVVLRYAWPFKQQFIAQMLATHLRQFGALHADAAS
jgi:sirohydrochlorin cobaltochelatase